jgi:aspartate racemase
MATEPAIGVIGGMGPYAGLDLVRKIFDQTRASRDQDHLPVALLSFPHRIPDRSTFLFDEMQPTPVPALTAIARQLDAAGITVAGIPCNTAHAPAIFGAVCEDLATSGHKIRLLNMIEEAVRFAREQIPGLQRIGVLSTLAVYRLCMYQSTIEATGFDAVMPDEDIEINLVNQTIFDDTWGIKAQANPVTARARQNLLDAIAHLREKGAEAVILGCTELPLAISEPEVDGVLMIDPTRVLARALIRETYPEKLL